MIAAIRDVDAVAASYRDAYERFKARFASLDDGKAGARVCDRLFPDLHRPDSAWQNAALPGGAASTLDPARD